MQPTLKYLLNPLRLPTHDMATILPSPPVFASDKGIAQTIPLTHTAKITYDRQHD